VKFRNHEPMKLWNHEPVKLWNHEPVKLWSHEPVKLWTREPAKLSAHEPVKLRGQKPAKFGSHDKWRSSWIKESRIRRKPSQRRNLKSPGLMCELVAGLWICKISPANYGM
jgi:hypothetical protein